MVNYLSNNVIQHMVNYLGPIIEETTSVVPEGDATVVDNANSRCASESSSSFSSTSLAITQSDAHKLITDLLKKVAYNSTCYSQEVWKILAKHVKREQIDPIMQACDHLFGAAVNNMTLLTGGRGTSVILKFEAAEREYVCRVTDSARPVFFIDTTSEVYNMNVVNKLNLTPQVLHADDKTGVMIMDYVNNISLTTQILKDESQSDALYAELAKSLSTLHNGPKFAGDTTSIFTDVEVTAKGGDFSLMPSDAVTAFQEILGLKSVLQKHQTSAPCHKELNGNNVLFDGKKVFFIDWEGSANCDPFVDLAICSLFFVFDDAKDDVLLKSYLGQAPTEEQKAHLFLLKQVCYAFYAFKSLRRVTGRAKIDLSKEQVDPSTLPTYKNLVLEYFNGCSKVCTTEDFKLFSYVFLREVTQNLNTTRYRDAVSLLSK